MRISAYSLAALTYESENEENAVFIGHFSNKYIILQPQFNSSNATSAVREKHQCRDNVAGNFLCTKPDICHVS